MKRIISYFLVITILVTCMIPAFTINAADGAKISATDATPVFGETSFESEITIADNPGIATLEVVVFFKTTDISSVDVDFTGTVYDPENCGIGSVIAGTNNKVKSLISGLGLTPADYKAVIVDLTTTEGDNTDANGKLFSAVFAANGEPAVGTALSYGIAVKPLLMQTATMLQLMKAEKCAPQPFRQTPIWVHTKTSLCSLQALKK